MNTRTVRSIVLVLNIVFAIAPPAMAQTNSGELTGRITDKSESVVPNTRVLATNTGTGDVHETVSTHEGYFVMTFLAPGSYEVSAAAQGFMKAVRSGVRIGAGQRVNVSLTLEVGSVTDAITVSAAAQQLNTEDAKVRHVIDSSQAQDLPLMGAFCHTCWV